MSEHPSYLALDRAALEGSTTFMQAHLQRCERCRAHLEQLRAASPMPASVRAIAPARRIVTRLGWMLAAAVASTAALTFGLSLGSPDDSGSRAKGAPALTVFVKHGEQVYRWDGSSALLAGDEIRLEVRGAGYRHVVVSTQVEDQEQVLYEGSLGGDALLLVPAAWKLDGAPGPEKLWVRLTGGNEPWSQRLLIPKRLEEEE